MNKPIYAPFARPLYVMPKPAGPRCNLACTYCYYTEKSKLYADNPRQVMSDEMLERYVREYIESQTSDSVLFTWHGGEALMRPIEFYRKALELQRRYAGGRHIENTLQTNGTLLTEEWCHFLRDNGFLVGLSIDGPQEFHDEYRRSRSGKPSWVEVMRGARLLTRLNVEWNAMAVVNDFNGDYPLDFYRFFRDELGCRYLQFAPIVERAFRHPDGRLLAAPCDGAEAVLTDFSVSPEQWGTFLCALFDEWVQHDVGTMFVQLFDATLANRVGVMPGVCTLAETCGHAGVMEFNGDVYSCDHFVFPEYKLGNIRTQTLTEMMYSERQLAFGQAKKTALPRQCRECDVLNLCHGECPKNRFAHTADGEPGLNYLCEGYRKFFRHVQPYMDFMAAELAAERPPANVMPWAQKRLAGKK